MAELKAAAFDTEKLFELLEASFAAGAWSLLDVCCMCASSKLLRSAWLQLLKQQPNPAWLLAAAADAAHARTQKLEHKAIAVVRWLLNSLPEARLAEHPSVPAGLLAIPRVPTQLAKTLCQFGVKVPYKTIAAAARRRVEGVEVWIKVQSGKRLGYKRHIDEIPFNIERLFSGIEAHHIGQSIDWEDRTWLHDFLYLSINSYSGSGIAEAAADVMVWTRGNIADIPAAEALDLLHIAVERNHTAALYGLLWGTRGAFRIDSLPPRHLLPIIERAMELDATHPVSSARRLRHLSELPAVEQLTADAVTSLLHKALQLSACKQFRELCKLPAAKHISRAQLASIVEAAAGAGSDFSLDALAKIPAFHQL